jgi:hypothetical protein
VNLADAELQQTTGLPIAKGELSIGSEADMAALCLLKHDRVLLQEGPHILAVWPVTSISRDGHGFCETSLGEFGLLFNGFGARDIARFSSPGASQSFMRGGIHAGYLMRRNVLEGSHPNVIPHTPQTTPICDYELKAEYRSEGLYFAISGYFAAAPDSGASHETTMLNEKAFSLVATIPWAILILKDFSGALHHRKFDRSRRPPSKNDSLDRTLEPRSLRGVLIDQSFGWPLVRGSISLAPESALPPRTDRYATSGFLHINIGKHTGEWISFSDAPQVEIFNNGFAWSSISIRSLTVAMIGWDQLGREFERRDSFSMTLVGDAVGSVSYAVDETERVGPNMVSQQIRNMSLRMKLGESGLEISADGELKEIEPAENPRHRENRNLQDLLLNPIRSYALAATVPWALLAVKEFQFAHRVRFV